MASSPLPQGSPGGALPRPADFELTSLLGANVFATESVLVGRLASAHPAADPGDLAASLEAAGLAGDAGAVPASFARQVEFCVAALRARLELDPVSVAPDAPPDDCFVVPLEPINLAQDIARFGFAAARLRPAAMLAELARSIASERARTASNHHMAALGRECARRGVPFRRLPWSGMVHQIGEGRHLLRMNATTTGRSGGIAAVIAGSKAETNRLLAHSGVSVARQAHARSAEEAWAAARQIGFPVVVKPRTGREGQGVSVGLSDRAGVETAFRTAMLHDDVALVESQIIGVDHRVLVANGRVIAVARRRPPTVTGNGRDTIATLIETENRNPERASGRQRTLMKPIMVDPEVERRVAAQGFTLASVPPAGSEIVLRYVANVSAGGYADDLTDSIHPAHAARIVRAVRLVGLDVAGVDYITPDISADPREVGGSICEVNARPGLYVHFVAEAGSGRSIMARLLLAIVDTRRDLGVPVILVGAAGADAIIADFARRLRGADGASLGAIGSDWLGFDGEVLDRPRLTSWHAHQMLTEDDSIGAIVMAVSAGSVLAEGLGVAAADIALLAPGWENGAEAALGVVESTGAAIERLPESEIGAALARHAARLGFDVIP